MPERVVVRVPATVANLGPGFDCLGLALTWYDEVRVERAPETAVTVAGVGADRIPRDETNLVLRGLRAVLGDDAAVRVHQMNAVAYGRGFGSSAAAIVAGLVAGRALGDTGQDARELLALATGIEGHADNVAPCLAGGVSVVAGETAVRLDPPPGIRPLVCVAASRLSTRTARAAIPPDIPLAEAVGTVGRAALLAASLATGRSDLLMEATEDVLHQPRRFELMPDTGDLVRALRAEGVAAFLSGAGPSVAALVPEEDAARAVQVARRLAPEGWDVRLESFDATGATIVESV